LLLITKTTPPEKSKTSELKLSSSITPEPYKLDIPPYWIATPPTLPVNSPNYTKKSIEEPVKF